MIRHDHIRRHFLRFLGLGSLFATASAVTPNQARASNGLQPISPGFIADEIHEWRPRGTFPPDVQWQWQYRVRSIDFLSTLDRNLAVIINAETADGSELVCMSSRVGGDRDLVFRRRIPIMAAV